MLLAHALRTGETTVTSVFESRPFRSRFGCKSRFAQGFDNVDEANSATRDGAIEPATSTDRTDRQR
jgi:hypothetical protein